MAGASRAAWQADAATWWQQGVTLAAGPGLEITWGFPTMPVSVGTTPPITANSLSVGIG